MESGSPSWEHDTVLVVNFGGQYAHLISRRLRDLGVYTVVVSYSDPSLVERASHERVKAIVLSGGPASVLEEGAPRIDRRILQLGKPVLGICYGHQLIAAMYGGRVEKGAGEYGRTIVRIAARDPLFEGWGEEEEVWMSHSDYVAEPPEGASVLAYSRDTGYIAAFKLREIPVYGVQFHPEVSHTPKGTLLLENFVERIAKANRTWRPEDYIDRAVREIREAVGSEEKILVAVSGGVDSTVTALLAKRAVGERLVAVLVDHGLFREGEVAEVTSMLRQLGVNPIVVDAREEFLSKLRGVSDPEEKRRVVGETFARIFREVASRDPKIKWLAQGTTYPDVVESGAEQGADRIKSHHNVAGLPSWLGLKVLEPLRYLYKDEVRRIAVALGVPHRYAYRHPFPGPGLAVRVIGEVTEEKLRIARRASRIVEEELLRAGLYYRVWQAFAVVGDDKWVGVKGDRRAEGHIVIVRVVESEDAMTADWARIPHEVLDRIARRITSELPEVTMVAYAITSKPPATIEPQ
ncbi:MAG: glutamine-hydrolyzing GMP synthase [Thermoproteota archaeon]